MEKNGKMEKFDFFKPPVLGGHGGLDDTANPKGS